MVEVGQLPEGDGAPYERIAADIRGKIEDGTLPVGTKLPSYRQMRDQYGVAQMTIASAIRVLKAERLLDGQHGRGVYVRRTP